jgi:heme-degrading monooxygenase HmoA
MIARIWRTKVVPERRAEFERFAKEKSLPMFHKQAGFLGVMFLNGLVDTATLTFWENMDAVNALAKSETYHETVRQIEAAGFLVRESSIEVFEVFGGGFASESIFRGELSS